MARFFIISTLLWLFCTNAIPQTPQNLATWTGYEGYHPFREGASWGLFVEAYLKRSDFIASKMAWFLRVGTTHYLKNGNRISGGLAYQYNFPYDQASEPYNWADYRIWQQYMIRRVSHNGSRFWIHRIRPEERWMQRTSSPELTEPDYYKFELTLRYMLRRQWWLHPNFGITVYDETHLRLTDLSTEKLIDQNRIYSGILFSPDKKRDWRMELGYMFQSTWNSPDTEEGRKRINHTIRLTITSDRPFHFGKNKKTL